jgi:hypothetical protein
LNATFFNWISCCLCPRRRFRLLRLQIERPRLQVVLLLGERRLEVEVACVPCRLRLRLLAGQLQLVALHVVLPDLRQRRLDQVAARPDHLAAKLRVLGSTLRRRVRVLPLRLRQRLHPIPQLG